jgi:hypothetical protein
VNAITDSLQVSFLRGGVFYLFFTTANQVVFSPMGIGSPFPGNKVAGVRQTLQTFVDTNFKENFSQEQKNCFQIINARHFEIRTLVYKMVIAGISDGSLH